MKNPACEQVQARKVKARQRMLQHALRVSGNVSQTCRFFGVSRSLFYIWKKRYERDQIVDFVRSWSERTAIGAGRFIRWLDITASKSYGWREQGGKGNEHNGSVPWDLLDGRLGEADDHCIPSEESVGRL
jgi:Homeodomain-like domain